jgi:hypothetical protein
MGTTARLRLCTFKLTYRLKRVLYPLYIQHTISKYYRFLPVNYPANTFTENKRFILVYTRMGYEMYPTGVLYLLSLLYRPFPLTGSRYSFVSPVSFVSFVTFDSCQSYSLDVWTGLVCAVPFLTQALSTKRYQEVSAE